MFATSEKFIAVHSFDCQGKKLNFEGDECLLPDECYTLTLAVLSTDCIVINTLSIKTRGTRLQMRHAWTITPIFYTFAA